MNLITDSYGNESRFHKFGVHMIKGYVEWSPKTRPAERPDT